MMFKGQGLRTRTQLMKWQTGGVGFNLIKGDQKVCFNYRRITLLPFSGKPMREQTAAPTSRSLIILESCTLARVKGKMGRC